MSEDAAAAPTGKPLWRQVAGFPLVAMVIAFALFALASWTATLVGVGLPIADAELNLVARAAIAILFVLAVYKLAINRLGDPRRDDLPARGALKGLGLGVAAGFIIFSVIVGVAAILDVYNIIGQGSLRSLVTTAITIAILPAFMEEMLFRGILFHYLEQFGGSWLALALTSGLFGLAHIYNPNASALASLAIAIEAGILLGGAYMLTRNLWMAMGLHASWNFTQGYIYDVPVSGFAQDGMVEARLSGDAILSGGAFGLEASAIAMVVATIAGIWLVARAVRDGKLVRPWWVRRRLAQAESAPATA
jgi:membrane protease YdiL (CAAX protease family)